LHRIARRDFVPVEARGLARMGVPAREDAMDAMVPCEVRAAANVNETPWGVALPNVDRSETSARRPTITHHLASARRIRSRDLRDRRSDIFAEYAVF
jgi:hypothetical protein